MRHLAKRENHLLLLVAVLVLIIVIGTVWMLWPEPTIAQAPPFNRGFFDETMRNIRKGN